MPTYEVVFEVPAHFSIRVEADNPEDALDEAMATDEFCEDWPRPQIDWDADPEWQDTHEVTEHQR